MDSAKEELFGLVSHSNMRFYAHENGDFLHIGVWVSSTQSQGLHAFGASQQLVLHYALLREWAVELRVKPWPRTLAQFVADWNIDRINDLMPPPA